MTDAHDGALPLYDQVGGQDGIDAMVDQFYEGVLTDPELRPFFESADRAKLLAMQKAFFAAALGGPVAYSGTSLHDAHAGRGIEPRHLSAFTEHLMATLHERGVPPDAADEIVSRIAQHADDIVGGGGEDG